MVKFMYLRDPSFRKNRTLTVARRKLSDTEMELSYAINLIEREFIAYQENGYIPEEMECESFNKAKGRAISKGLLEQKKERRFVITKDKDTPFYVAVLNFLENDAPHFFANKIGKHYNDLRREATVAAVNVQEVA